MYSFCCIDKNPLVSSDGLKHLFTDKGDDIALALI